MRYAGGLLISAPVVADGLRGDARIVCAQCGCSALAP
jgi:hypothetical protein